MFLPLSPTHLQPDPDFAQTSGHRTEFEGWWGRAGLWDWDGSPVLTGPVRTSQTQGPSGPWPSSQGMETVPGSGAPRGWGEPRLLPSEEPGAAPQLRTFSGKEAQGFCSTEGLNEGGTRHFGRTFQKLTGYRQGEVVKEPS